MLTKGDFLLTKSYFKREKRLFSFTFLNFFLAE